MKSFSKKTRIGKLSVLVIASLVTCMLSSACSGSSKTSASVTPEATSQSGPLEITMLAPFYQQEPPNTKNNPVLDFMQKTHNVEFKFTWVPNGEIDNKFNVLMASNDMLMVMNTISGATSSNFIRMAQSGSFWDLTDIIKDYPIYYEKLITPTLATASLTKGKRYVIPFNVPDGRIALLYREDWVEKLGLKLPEILTVKDFYNLAKAFTENDPDGDGKKNTTGFNYVDDGDKEISYGIDTIAVGLGAPNRWGIRDGKAVPYFDTPEYLETLKLLNDMYKNKYLNEEFATLGSGAKYNPMLQGRAGLMFTTAVNSINPGGKFDNLIATNPKAKIGYKLLLLDPKGNKVVNSNITGVAGGITFTKTKIKTEADLRRILQVFADMNKGESAKALDLGIKDIHYSVGSDNKITISPDQEKLRTTDGSRELFASLVPKRVMAEDWGQPATQTDLVNRNIVSIQKYAVPDMSIGLISSENSQLQNTIAPIITDARVKFIMGFIDEKAFKQAVQQWKDQGGQKIIDEITANYTKK